MPQFNDGQPHSMSTIVSRKKAKVLNDEEQRRLRELLREQRRAEKEAAKEETNNVSISKWSTGSSSKTTSGFFF